MIDVTTNKLLFLQIPDGLMQRRIQTTKHKRILFYLPHTTQKKQTTPLSLFHLFTKKNKYTKDYNLNSRQKHPPAVPTPPCTHASVPAPTWTVEKPMLREVQSPSPVRFFRLHDACATLGSQNVVWWRLSDRTDRLLLLALSDGQFPNKSVEKHKRLILF